MKPAGFRQKIASKRIEILFEQAVLRPAYAKRYVALARKMASRHKVRIPQKLKRRFCKSCNAFLTAVNSRVRVRAGKIVTTCLECSGVKRLKVK